MRPVLAALADGSPWRARDLVPMLADQFKLSDVERKQLLPSGAQQVIDNRIAWALTYLAKAGLLVRPQRGYVEITPAGKKALHDYPDRIDNKILITFPSFQEFITSK